MSIPANKSLGQHWLNDKATLDSIVDVADLEPGDTILEIGPGHGSLTKAILDKDLGVIAIELDESLAKKLKKEIDSDNLTVINEDILSFNLSSLPRNYKVIANIPYYLTSNLIRNLSETLNPPLSITILVQKEVAERVCAKPGNMSILSVSAQTYYDCRLGPIILADKFDPPPKVDSQVAHMVRKQQPLVDDKEKKVFFRVVKAGFSNRRKTLLNSLSGGLQLTKDETKAILVNSGIDPGSRPQELSLEGWLNLAAHTSLFQGRTLDGSPKRFFAKK